MAYATDEQIELLLDTVDGGKPQTLRHLVQYADEKAKEIQNKLAKEGIAKIRTSWNNLNTLQPVLQEMLNGMEDVTVHVVVSIQQKRKRVLADAALSGPAANQKHLKKWKGFEKPKTIIIDHREWTTEDVLTPKMSVKRRVLEDRFKDKIAQIP